MADEAWPTQLSHTPRELSLTRPQAVERSENDAGPREVRLRSTASPRVWTVSFRWATVEWAIFDVWYKDTIFFGARTFTWTDPVGSTLSVDARLIAEPVATVIGYSVAPDALNPANQKKAIYDVQLVIEEVLV